MQKTLTNLGFIISSILVVLVFVTAKTYVQLAIAVMVYPLLAYFALKLFPRKTQEIPMLAVQTTSFPLPINNTPTTNTVYANQDKVEIVDIDKRTFLKLLGTAGISFFIFSLLGRRAEDLMFGGRLESGLKNSGIIPNEQATDASVPPTEGFRISEIDDDIISYYGFTNKQGNWLVMREDSENNSFRYAKGEKDFSKNWEKRGTLKYDYYYNLF